MSLMRLWSEWIRDPVVFESLLFLISIAAGILGALLGLGGGVIVVPALTLLFGIDIRYAVGASLVSVIATSSGAAVAYVRDRLTNIRLAILLEVATTLGALSGAMLAPYLSSTWLYFIFGVTLIYSSLVMLRPRRSETIPVSESHPLALRFKLNSSYPDVVSGAMVPYGVARLPFGVSVMYLAGVLSALLGIGSGALKVPAMDGAMRLPIKVSSATSSFMIGVTGAASAGAYYMRGDILPILAAPVALGVLLGSSLGSQVMKRARAPTIRKLFVVVLLIVALQMILRALNGGGRA